MNDYGIYLNFFAVGALIPTLFAVFLALFFATVPNKSGATWWMVATFVTMAPFYLAYVPASAILDPFAAYHRWLTMPSVMLSIPAVTQVLLRSYGDSHRRLANVLGVLQLSGAVLATALFYARTINVGQTFEFTGHYWDLNAARASWVNAVVILGNMFIMLGAGFLRSRQLSGIPRWSVLGVGLAFFLGTFPAGITNVLSYEGAIDRGLHQTVMTLSSLGFFFAAVIVYINTARDRTTFMAKIIGVSTVTFLLLLQFISYFATQGVEVAYDRARSVDSELVAAGAEPTALNRYTAEFRFHGTAVAGAPIGAAGTAGLPRTEVCAPDARNTLLFETIRARTPGQGSAARAQSEPGNSRFRWNWPHGRLNAAPASRGEPPRAPAPGEPAAFQRAVEELLAEFRHPELAGHEAVIRACVGLSAAGAAVGAPVKVIARDWKGLVGCIEEHRRPIHVLATRIYRMEEDNFRHDLTRALAEAKPQVAPFVAAIRAHLQKSQASGAALKREVLPYVAPMQPAGTRLYRMHTSPDLRADPFTAFHHVDLANNRVYEVGFSYRAYRAFIHPTALMLTTILLIGLAVILIGYRIFFSGALLAPLLQLLEGVKRVNRGQLDTHVPVKVADEIGFLSESFNTMVDTIRDARDNLERKVTERTEEVQAAYDKLKELDTLKTSFFANVSHELRTPLTLMLTPMESIIAGELGSVPDNQRQFLLSAHRNGQKLLKLISNLLDFSKLEAGRLSLSYRELNFVEYVKGLAAAFDSSARAAGIEIKLSAERDKIAAFFDPEKMEKIVLNLLSNAFKFTEQGGVFIEIGADDDNITMTVRDTGIGIPADKLDVVFERFSQVDGSASRKYEGTGIGLALARELALAHQGTLRAVPCDTGAHFVLSFPRVPEEMRGVERALRAPASHVSEGSEGDPAEGAVAGAEARRSSTRGALLAELQERQSVTLGNDEDSIELVVESLPATRSSETVLIVEDTHDMRKLLYFLLAPHFQLITARNGREGLEKAHKHKPDMILSDIMMPEMNGYELTLALRQDQELRATPVVLLSAKADVGMRIHGLDQGADDYVVKPFNSAELLSRIRGQLRIRGMQREIMMMRDRLQELNDKLSGQVQLQVSELMLSEKFRNYLPPQLVDSILRREGDAKVRSERKKVTVFFSDIVDFTRMTDELEPEDLGRLLNNYLSEMTRIARKHDAVVDKFIGDALLCHFGALNSRGEKGDAEAGVAMAVEMQLRMRELSAEWIEQGFSEPLQIRCGLATGFVAVGNFGSDERLDYTVIGSQVNLASRIQAHAEPGGILISHSTWALVNRSVRSEPAGDIEPKGFRRSFPVYRVLM